MFPTISLGAIIFHHDLEKSSGVFFISLANGQKNQCERETN